MFKRHILAICVTQCCMATAFAQTITNTELATKKAMPVAASVQAEALPTIHVQAIDSQTTLSSTQLERKNANNLRNVFDDLAGVNITDTGRSRQLGDIEIRGMGGMSSNIGFGSNRVSMEIDGMELSQAFNFGHNMSYGRQYFDPEDLKQVQIHKGPGSSGFAGSVKFKTKDPSDYLPDGQKFSTSARLGYRGDIDERMAGLSIAGQISPQQSASLSYTHRKYHELDNDGLAVVGTSRTARNPLDGHSHSANAKWVYQPSPTQKFSLTGQYYQFDNDTVYLDRVGRVTTNRARTTTTTTLAESNTSSNQRMAIALQHESKAKTALFDSVSNHLSWQKTKSDADN
ncbi:MAG: TonB-dependent receptor plug domain-containing protein, partial [Acinetobacter sp.]|nr:TonB-dependent receptor plug domain-containing protein [Acinetobacter sp.]